jgi:hypothetical protein
MNNPIKTAYEIYNTYQGDITEDIKWHLDNGVVVSSATCFMLGFYCSRFDTTKYVSKCNADCFFITLCVGDMREALQTTYNTVLWVAYNRELKGDKRLRMETFDKFNKKIKWAA